MKIFNLGFPRELNSRIFDAITSGKDRLRDTKVQELFGKRNFNGMFYSEKRKIPIPKTPVYNEFGITSWTLERRLRFYDEEIPDVIKRVEGVSRDKVGLYIDTKGREYIAPFIFNESSVSLWGCRISTPLQRAYKRKYKKPLLPPGIEEVVTLRRGDDVKKMKVKDVSKEHTRSGTTFAIEMYVYTR